MPSAIGFVRKRACLYKTFKVWLEKHAPKVMKGMLTRKAMDYTLNQWDTLTGYCERGDYREHRQRAAPENAIRPFALAGKARLFADTCGTNASVPAISLMEQASQ